MSKSLGTMGLGGKMGNIVLKCPLFWTIRNDETILVDRVGSTNRKFTFKSKVRLNSVLLHVSFENGDKIG